MESHSVICHPAAVIFPPLHKAQPILSLVKVEGSKAELTWIVDISQDSIPTKYCQWQCHDWYYYYYYYYYRANRRGFTPYCHDLDTLAESAQHDLFRHSRHSAHCLNHLYTTKLKPPGAMRLRRRGRDFELPTVKFEFIKRNFIVCSLFQYVWLCIYRFILVWLCCDF